MSIFYTNFFSDDRLQYLTERLLGNLETLEAALLQKGERDLLEDLLLFKEGSNGQQPQRQLSLSGNLKDMKKRK